MSVRDDLSVFRSAITGSDGSIDPGYLAMFWLMVVVLNAIPFILVASLFKGTWDPQGLGVAIGAICGGFAVVVGAVGAFRMGDKPRPGVTETTTATATKTEVK